MPTAAIKTFGCKLNQYESEQIRTQLERLGYAIVDFASSADVYIINSCTVTHRADRDTRKLARYIKRRHPQAVLVVTGCYAEVAPEELQAIPEIDIVCGNEDKKRIGELLASFQPAHAALSASLFSQAAQAAPAESAEPSASAASDVDFIEKFSGHTRCFVKVQEGCNAQCAYCIIPRARGPSRSVPVEDVLEQARRLGRAGHPELVLIGTHLGQYGQDLQPKTDLAELIEQLLALPEVRRLRLSSIEPREISDRLLTMLPYGGRALAPLATPYGKLCRHLHIPLQSGCDKTLQRMNRPYDTSFYAHLIERIHRLQPATCLGADVIVGFPGETEEEFAQTAAFIEALPLSYLHVFTYSVRRGTPAAKMPHHVPHEVAIQRNQFLRAISERKRKAFAAQMIGQILEIVLQTPDENEQGYALGLADNYLLVRVPAPQERMQQLAACEILDLDEKEIVLRGRLL